MIENYVMSWVCHDGAIAKLIIPETADDDDLLAIGDFYEVIKKRHFKLRKGEADVEEGEKE